MSGWHFNPSYDLDDARERHDALMGALAVDVCTIVQKLPAPKPKRQRKPRLDRLIKEAEQGGKRVASITTSDGVTLTFGESAPAEDKNPWLADLEKRKQQ
jgi:hypothetical protein